MRLENEDIHEYEQAKIYGKYETENEWGLLKICHEYKSVDPETFEPIHTKVEEDIESWIKYYKKFVSLNNKSLELKIIKTKIKVFSRKEITYYPEEIITLNKEN